MVELSKSRKPKTIKIKTLIRGRREKLENFEKRKLENK